MENQIKVTLMDHMGSDLTVANAARVTMGVTHKELDSKDERLINFLAREHHVTPFRHATVTFRCEAPIAIARQLGKHQVGFSWNEMSRRYKDGEVKTFKPEVLFHRPANLHEGSGKPFTGSTQEDLSGLIDAAYRNAVNAYDNLLAMGVAPEQARFVLPQGMITEWVWTGSLFGWAELCRQRQSEHAQYEVRLFADQVDEEMSKLYPIAWKALKETHVNT